MRIKDMLTRKNKRGFTLVELMIVVAIIGVLAALAIYGVRKYLTNAKTAEARTALGRIAKDASSAWDREKMAGDVLSAGGTADNTRALCLSATNKVPADPASISGKKYQSSPAEWNVGDINTGWKCLRFTMDGPQYFMYTYIGEASSFTARANGDLDSDGNLSTFDLAGAILDASGEKAVTIAPAIAESNVEE